MYFLLADEKELSEIIARDLICLYLYLSSTRRQIKNTANVPMTMLMNVVYSCAF